jgi:HAD superfamily phosphoserine phosphatase-like hydrolase
MREAPVLLLDFDGTSATSNVGMSFIEKFSEGDAWKKIDDDYGKGKFGSRRAYELLGPMLGGTPLEWREYVRSHHYLDPGFTALVTEAVKRGWRVEILSDGLDFYIEEMLGEAGVKLPVRAGVLGAKEGGAKISTPHMNPECGYCGTCKSSRVDELAAEGREVVFVGDGLSDRCAAPRARRTFAKDLLADHLREQNLPFEEYKTLFDVKRALFGE